MASIAPEVHTISTDEVRNVSIDCSSMLASGELLTGTPTVQASPALTIGSEQVNVAEVEINGVDVAIGKAVQFTAAAAYKGKFLVEIVVSTSGGQTIEGTVKLNATTTRYG